MKTSYRCDSCEALMINGVYCHETGCPNAWMGKKKHCFQCGFDFVPEYRFQAICEDCFENDEEVNP